MDQSVKTMISVIISFIGALILLSCVCFFLKAANARSTLYSVIEHVEIYGYNNQTIDDYAEKTKTTIQVLPVQTNNKKYRYLVTVSFDYTFAFIDFKKDVSYSGYTRFVSY